MTNDNLDDARRRAIHGLLATTAGDSEHRLEELQAVRQLFHDELASAAQPALNAVLREKDRDDVDARRGLCSWANKQLRLLGLAVNDGTGRPSILIADSRDAEDLVGRYRLEHRDSSGRAIRTLTSATLPDLTLMPDPPRTESLARGFRKWPKDDPSR